MKKVKNQNIQIDPSNVIKLGQVLEENFFPSHMKKEIKKIKIKNLKEAIPLILGLEHLGLWERYCILICLWKLKSLNYIKTQRMSNRERSLFLFASRKNNMGNVNHQL